MSFVIPSDPGALPILVQLILTEFALDGLRLASLNTPNVLSNSLSVVGGLLLAVVLAATNQTVDGRRSYLYPLIPWNGKAMARLVFRLKKTD